MHIDGFDWMIFEIISFYLSLFTETSEICQEFKPKIGPIILKGLKFELIMSKNFYNCFWPLCKRKVVFILYTVYCLSVFFQNILVDAVTINRITGLSPFSPQGRQGFRLFNKWYPLHTKTEIMALLCYIYISWLYELLFCVWRLWSLLILFLLFCIMMSVGFFNGSVRIDCDLHYIHVSRYYRKEKQITMIAISWWGA